MRTSNCIFLAIVALCVFWMDLTAAYPMVEYGQTERDDNDTAGPVGFGLEEPSTYYPSSMDKRALQPRGPLDDCKSYFDCKSRFIKYLDGLARMGKMG